MVQQCTIVIPKFGHFLHPALLGIVSVLHQDEGGTGKSRETSREISRGLGFCSQSITYFVAIYTFLVSNFWAGNGAGVKNDKYEVWKFIV